MAEKSKCKDCGKKKELTVHGTCWKCHVGSLTINDRIIARKNG